MKLAPTVFGLLALALALPGCFVGEDDDGEGVGESDDALKARGSGDPSLMVANVRAGKSGQTVTARFTMPAASEPNVYGCTYAARSFTLKVKLGAVERNKIVVQSVRIAFDSAMSPAALSVFDSRGSSTFMYGSDKFLAGGLRRAASSHQLVPVSASFIPQANNGEGVNVQFSFFDDGGEKLECARMPLLALVVRGK